MAGTERQMWLLLTLISLSLFGVAFSQCSTLPDAAFIQTRIQSIVSSGGGEGSNPVATLIQHHFTCIAVGSMQGTFRSLSIAVRYNVTSSNQPVVQRIRQLLLTCSGTNFVLQSPSNEVNQPESLFDLETRRDCLVCAIDGSATIDPDTNCAACDPMCAGGQGGCVTSATDCCQFYDIVTNMCINTCPAGSINTTDFTCDPCLNSPCQNQGTCITDSGLNYTCNCAGSFIGTNCDMCSLNCMNEGNPNPQCTACMCAVGFTGNDCATNIDDCSPNPCANGNCTDGTGGYTCTCDPIWTGTNCDSCLIANCVRCVNAECMECNRGLIWNSGVKQCVDVCFDNPCQNGGTCTFNSDGGFTCQCPTSRAGTNCTMCASGYTTVENECALCRDTRCLTCSNGVDVCSECRDGFQLQDDTKQCTCVTELSISALIGIVIASTTGVIFGLLGLVLIVTTVIVVAVIVVWKKKVKAKTTESTAGAPPVLYENIDPLSQCSSVKTALFYENTPAVSFSPPKSNIEMKECPAYGVITS